MNKRRRATIQSIFGKIEELRDQIEEVQNEEQEAYDNLPEGCRTPSAAKR